MPPADVPAFNSRNPADPEFWSERFEHGFTPWDRGGVPQALQEFARRMPRPPTALIPGCGSGHEIAFLCEAGWDVTAIDFSPAAVALARNTAGPWAARIIEADFFRYQPPAALDLIYERAFLCALPRAMWPQVAARWAELLPSGGLLAGFFYFAADPKGPPFGTSPDELATLLNAHFTLTEERAVEDSIAVFAGRERWQVWRRH